MIQSRCPQIPIQPDIERTSPPPAATSADIKAAQDLLVSQKKNDPTFKDPSKRLKNVLRSSSTKQKKDDAAQWLFKPHQLSAALRKVVEESDNAPLARALIEKGADTNMFHKPPTGSIMKSSGEATPIDYLLIAVRRNATNILSVLASYNPPANNVEAALKQAVEQKLAHACLILLQQDVDPNVNGGAIFDAAVASQDVEIVTLLLRARSKVHHLYVSRNLLIAVEQGNPKLTATLVKYGADVTFADGAALNNAVRKQDVTLVLILLSGLSSAASAKASSAAIDECLSNTSTLSNDEQYLLLESLLCAGATGDSVARCLVSVTRSRRLSFAGLLIKYGANVAYDDNNALRIAVSSCTADLVTVLLEGNVTKAMASALIDEIPLAADDDEMLSMLDLLTARGARGSSLNRALIRAVQRKHHRSVGLLLDHDAKVDADNHQPLRVATTDGNLELLQLLTSKGHPTTESFQTLLPLIPQSPPHINLEMTSLVIRGAGPNGLAANLLDEALYKALISFRTHFVKTIAQLINVLLEAGASPDHQSGRSFRLVAETGSSALLKTFIPRTKKPVSFNPAVPIYMKLNDLDLRRYVIGLILRNGAKGTEIDQALIDALEERPPDDSLVHIISVAADLDFADGQALYVAALSTPIHVMRMLLGATTSYKCRERALKGLSTQATPQRLERITALLDAGVRSTAKNESLVREISSFKDLSVVSLLLDREASCEYNNYKSLSLGIELQNYPLLERLLATRPDAKAISNLVPGIMRLTAAEMRYGLLTRFISSGAHGTALDEALIQEVECKSHRDIQIMNLFIESGATVRHAEARVLRFAVTSAPSTEILATLLQQALPSDLLADLVQSTMRHDEATRIPMLRLLLGKGARGLSVNNAMLVAVAEGPQSLPTLDLLFKYEASINHSRAKAVDIAARLVSDILLQYLLSHEPDRGHLSGSLSSVMSSNSGDADTLATRRFHCAQHLIEYKAVGIAAIHQSWTPEPFASSSPPERSHLPRVVLAPSKPFLETRSGGRRILAVYNYLTLI